MPHDAYGHELKVGDTVYIPAQIKEIHQTEDYCNVMLETERVMLPGSSRTTLHLNAQQIDKVFNRQNPPQHSLGG